MGSNVSELQINIQCVHSIKCLYNVVVKMVAILSQLGADGGTLLKCMNYSPRHWRLNTMESLLNRKNLHFGAVGGCAGTVRYVDTPSPSWTWPSCLSWGIIRARYVLQGFASYGNLWTIGTEFGALISDRSIHFPDSSICILYDVGVSPVPTDSVQASNSSSSSIQLSSTNEILGMTCNDGKTGMEGFRTAITDAGFCFCKMHAMRG